MSDERTSIQIDPKFADIFRACYPLTQAQLWELWRCANQLDQGIANVPNPYLGGVFDMRTMLSGFMTIMTQLQTIKLREARGVLTSISLTSLIADIREEPSLQPVNLAEFDDQTAAALRAFYQVADTELTLLLDLLERVDAVLANFPNTGWDGLSATRSSLAPMRAFIMEVRRLRAEGVELVE